MYNTITQNHQNEEKISDSINKFFTRFRISSIMKAANAYKSKGFAVTQIFQYLFTLVFLNRSIDCPVYDAFTGSKGKHG